MESLKEKKANQLANKIEDPVLRLITKMVLMDSVDVDLINRMKQNNMEYAIMIDEEMNGILDCYGNVVEIKK